MIDNSIVQKLMQGELASSPKGKKGKKVSFADGIAAGSPWNEKSKKALHDATMSIIKGEAALVEHAMRGASEEEEAAAAGLNRFSARVDQAIADFSAKGLDVGPLRQAQQAVAEAQKLSFADFQKLLGLDDDSVAERKAAADAVYANVPSGVAAAMNIDKGDGASAQSLRGGRRRRRRRRSRRRSRKRGRRRSRRGRGKRRKTRRRRKRRKRRN